MQAVVLWDSVIWHCIRRAESIPVSQWQERVRSRMEAARGLLHKRASNRLAPNGKDMEMLSVYAEFVLCAGYYTKEGEDDWRRCVLCTGLTNPGELATE